MEPTTPAPDFRDRWAVPVVLSDGDSVYIRPITVADQPELLALHHRQPREDLYFRYFSAKSTLSPKELAHFTDIDFHDRVALVMEDRGDFIAWASYERWPGRDDADVAFLVDHAHHGRGIATLMLEHLAAIARANGIARFTAEVLYENKPMLRVFARAGWPVKRHLESGVTELEWALNDTEQFIDSVEAREHRADSSAMARLLLPRTIAVIGASDTPGTPGHALWHSVVRRFPGHAYPVNPAHAMIGDRPAYASVVDVPDDVWLAVVAVPAEQPRRDDRAVHRQARARRGDHQLGRGHRRGRSSARRAQPAQRPADHRSGEHGRGLAAGGQRAGRRRWSTSPRSGRARWRSPCSRARSAPGCCSSPTSCRWASPGSSPSATRAT